MKLIGDLLVVAKAITPEQRERAVWHAKKEKVRTGTALLDLGYLTEGVLLRALSVQRQVPPAPPAELRQVRPDIVRLVPAKLASRLRLVPFRRVGRQLSLAMRDPNDLPAIDEISFLTGLSIAPHVAPELRIELALFTYYEVNVAERFHRIGKRLEAGQPPLSTESGIGTDMHRTPSGSFVPSAASVLPPPPPPPPPPSTFSRNAPSGSFPLLSGDPWGAGELERARSAEVETFEETVAPRFEPVRPAPAARPAPAPVSAPAKVPAPAPPAAASPALPRPAPIPEIDDEDVRLLRGEAQVEAPPDVQASINVAETTGEISPLPQEAAEPESFDLVASLASAESRDDVAEAVLRAASELVRRAALFIVQSDRVLGWAAYPEPPEGLRSLQIPFSEPSVFATLRNTEGFYIGPSPDLAANRRALQALGVMGRASIAVVPVTLKTKSVLFLLAEFDSGTPPPPVTSLKRLASMTATALEILLLKNRLRQA